MDMLDYSISWSEAAKIDPLNVLYNNRYFFEVGSNMLAAAARGKARSVIAMMGIDHFKAVSDICGHAIADGGIRRATKISSTYTTRQDDLTARIDVYCEPKLSLNVMSPDASKKLCVANEGRRDMVVGGK